MRTRRQVLVGAAVSAIVAKTANAGSAPRVSEILPELEKALQRELPGLTKIEIDFCPEDLRVPLVVHAFRI